MERSAAAGLRRDRRSAPVVASNTIPAASCCVFLGLIRGVDSQESRLCRKEGRRVLASP